MTALDEAIAHPHRVVGIAERSPVAGLARRSVGFLDVLAQSVSAVAPSAAVTTFPVMVAAAAGGGTILALCIAMLLSLFVGATVNVFTRRMSATGSLYTFVAKSLGTGAAFVTGVALLIGYGFITMFALAGGGYYAALVFDHFWPSAAHSVALVSALVVTMAALSFLVLARGIRLSTRVTLWIESASVALIVVLLLSLLSLQDAEVGWSVLSLDGTSFGELATGAVLAISAFVGFESAATLGVEARRPFAYVPRAIFGTVLVCGGLFLLGTYSQLVGFATLGKDLASSTSPMNELTSAYGIEWIGLILDLSIATSFFACAVASTTALVRVLFAMAREGVIPKRLGRTHPRLKTPIFAILTVMPLLAGVPVLAILAGDSVWNSMGFLLDCAAAGYITAYVLVCIAAPVFLWRIRELTLWPVIRATVAAALLSVVLVVYLVAESSTPRALGVWIFLAIMALALLVYPVLRHRYPSLGARVGVFDETIAEDLLGAHPGLHREPGRAERPESASSEGPATSLTGSD